MVMNASEANDNMPEAFESVMTRLRMDGYSQAFNAYVREFYTHDPDHDFHLDIKAEHSRNVFTHACGLAGAEEAFAAFPDRARALLLAAMFHDFGRFLQYHRYGTFSDAQSVNHGRLAVREVKRLGLLRTEPVHVRHAALAGIILHNRYSLPARLPEGIRYVAEAVRDADKLDILRIMASHLTGAVPPDPVVVLHAASSPEVSPAVLEAVMRRRLASYTDLATTTDFIILVCGWFYDLNFAWSRGVFAKSSYTRSLLAALPETEELAAFTAQYRSDLAPHAAFD